MERFINWRYTNNLMYDAISINQHFERAHDSPHPWVESNFHLRATDMVIPLHRRLRIKELGGTNHSAFGKNDAQKGYVPSRYVASTGKWELILDYVPGLPPDYATFVRGHEEGHVYQKTGNLLTLLDETQRHGLEFEFFTKEMTMLSDQWVREFLTLYPNAVPSHPWYQGGIKDLDEIADGITILQFTLSEDTADVAGLLALIKGKYDPELISEVKKIIHKQTSQASFFRERLPDREIRAFWEYLYPTTQ